MPFLKKKKGESTEQQAVRTEMHKRKHGTLHSGSKKGPKVTNPKQSIAIGLSEARKAKGEGAAQLAPKKKRKKQ